MERKWLSIAETYHEFSYLEANQSFSSCSCSTFPAIYSPETYTLDWMLVKQLLCLCWNVAFCIHSKHMLSPHLTYSLDWMLVKQFLCLCWDVAFCIHIKHMPSPSWTYPAIKHSTATMWRTQSSWNTSYAFLAQHIFPTFHQRIAEVDKYKNIFYICSNISHLETEWPNFWL